MYSFFKKCSRIVRAGGIPLLLIGIVLAMAHAGNICEYVCMKTCCDTQPVRLSNEDGRCLSNSLLQMFYAATHARGWVPEDVVDDAFSQAWKKYRLSIGAIPNKDELLLGYTIDCVPAGTGIYSADDQVNRVVRWLRNAVPNGDQKICCARLEKPSLHSMLEQAGQLERDVSGYTQEHGSTPEIVIVTCDYTGDPAERWLWPEHWYPSRSSKDNVLTTLGDLQRPAIPTIFHTQGVAYRIVSMFNLVQDILSNSAAGKLFLQHQDSEFWKRLGKRVETCHATSCVRWGDRWFELDDCLRYELSVERKDGSSITDPALVDAMVMRSHPGMPMVCIFERVDHEDSCDSEGSLDAYTCVWVCSQETIKHIEHPLQHEILYPRGEMPMGARRTFTTTTEFVPA